ncbi:helix-turn-helix domain-containing protein [Peribacillus sp. SCS-155]|uniref:helix-turn-helix domain-containing protein n=1 Tax=Peribacillus sedimenti TaxID=3115297 RepID=UPI00390634ED
MSSAQYMKTYSIKDVSKRINIPTGTLRQWEKDLKGLLVIPRSQQGARFYTDKEVAILEKVKEMRAKNLSKDMIRTLLDKHINEPSEPSSETVESYVPTVTSQEIQPVMDSQVIEQTQLIEDFYHAMETYKNNMIAEIQSMMTDSRREMVQEISNELNQKSLYTVQGLSKSIQRSNEKNKQEFTELAQTIAKVSEYTSESFEILSEDISKASEDTYEKLNKRINETSRTSIKDYKTLVNKVSQTVNEAQKDIRAVSKSLHAEQEHFVSSMNDNLKELTQAIREREDAFQNMVSSFREAAAAKGNKKKWWRLWAQDHTQNQKQENEQNDDIDNPQEIH